MVEKSVCKFEKTSWKRWVIVWLACRDNMSIFLCYICRPVDDVEAGEIDGVIDCSGDATGVDGKNILL